MKALNKNFSLCGMTFGKKSNRDRHIKSVHRNDIIQPVLSITEPLIPKASTDPPDELNVSIISDDGIALEQSMSMIDFETPIFEMYDTVLSQDAAEAAYSDDQQRTDTLDGNVEIDIEMPIIQPSCDLEYPADDIHEDIQIDIVEELLQREQNREEIYEQLFKDKVLKKMQVALKTRHFRHATAKYLHDAFGDTLNDNQFIHWLARKLELRSCRMRDIMNGSHRTPYRVQHIN